MQAVTELQEVGVQEDISENNDQIRSFIVNLRIEWWRRTWREDLEGGTESSTTIA